MRRGTSFKKHNNQPTHPPPGGPKSKSEGREEEEMGRWETQGRIKQSTNDYIQIVPRMAVPA